MKFEARHTYVDKVIAKATLELADHEPDSEEYGIILDRIGKLQKIRQEEKPKLPSPDTAMLVAANLLGIFMIIKHENVNNITSKALGFVKRT